MSNRGQSSFIFYTTIIFGEILELYYLETLKTKQTQNSLLSKAVQIFTKNNRRFPEGSASPPPPISLICFHLFVLYHECLYTYYPSCSLSDLALHDTGENFISVVELVLNSIVYV